MENTTNTVGQVDQESWFLAQLEKRELPVKDLLRFLDDVRKKGQSDQANVWAETLQEALIERKDRRNCLLVLNVRALWGLKAAPIREALARLVGDSREDRILIENSGFDRSLAPQECIRRLQILFSLKPDVLVYDKTWGAGLVRKMDPFYARVEIDFDSKPGHQMSLAYAAEVLSLLREDHLMAIKLRKPEELKTLINENPAEVVRIALRSFGPLSIPLLQIRLAAAGVDESNWKRFWDGARKALKNDPLVEIPSKRTEPLRLLAKEKSHDDDWFRKLGAERDMGTVLSMVDEVSDDTTALESLSDFARNVLIDRLAFVIKGAGKRHSGLLIRAVMLAAKLQIDGETLQVRAHGEICLADDDTMFRILKDLPGRLVRPFFLFLLSLDAQRTLDRILALVPRFEMGSLTDAMTLLLENGREADCAALFRSSILSQTAQVEMLLWIARNFDRIQAWNLGVVPAISELMLIELEKDYNGERLKAKNQLRDRFEQKEWLKATFEPMRDVKRKEFMEKIKVSPAWSPMDRQSVMGKVIKQFPELVEVLVAKKNGEETRTPTTSMRMYRERQAQLEKIVNVEIPRIAREIGVARSYGDLRENFEYKAAKEMQSFLLKRKSELERMLHMVRPTDFQGMPCDKAGIATGVLLSYPDGHTEQYYLLGEWDQDDKLHIISSESRLAKSLEGHVAGEEVVIPTETVDVACRIEQVTELPPEIRAWIEGK
ncbi:MAG TPA: hypothetical protein DCZ95_14730 [Verrucomicrobia bacterium]|nr:MAG: hypothetical protein A2X46_18165 [Lentisphaerae bacterium GWF2_57_35]HBA85339.1 hypothetical protein [Verrucomicrobiota bacterium]